MSEYRFEILKDTNPDEVVFHVNGVGKYRIGWNDDDAFPFVYFVDSDDLMIGLMSECHRVAFPKIFGAKFGNEEDEYSFYSSFESGRVFKNLKGFGYRGMPVTAVVSAWDQPSDERVGRMLRSVIERFRLDPSSTLYCDYVHDPVFVFEWNSFSGVEVSDDDSESLRNLRSIHLMGGKDKRDALAGFRAVRDEKNGQKLGNMTQAKYNYYKYPYVDEGMIADAIRRVLLKESVFNLPDMSAIGQFGYNSYVDSDDYSEWLEENGFENSEESVKKYFYEEVVFQLDFYDNETYHWFRTEDCLTYDDIVDNYGRELADRIMSSCYGKFDDEVSGYVDKGEIANDEIDLGNPDEVNAFCMRYLPTTNYFKGCRGFILTNGVIVSTESEHNEILIVPGLESKFDFIRMGNIRIMPNSMDIGACPTEEQFEVLKAILRYYQGEELYLDLYGGRPGKCGCSYESASVGKVIGDIYRYYQEGIRPVT